MNDQSDTERGQASAHWFGLDRLRLSDDDNAIDVTIGSESHWDRSHLRRLRQSGDLPGMVPIIDSDFSADGKPFAVTPAVDAPTLDDMIASGDLDWTSGAGVAEAAARAAHEAHLRGLFHGALSPSDVFVIGDDVAIAGVGLGLGGTPPAERSNWVAPEVRDGADPTERSDVYSLGKILESSLGEALDTVPRSIRRLIMWSSSDTPEARPPSAMEFASILAEGLGEDRRTYGPAFIATAGASDLASRASSAVSSHTPTETAQNTASSSGLGVAAGAGAAAVAAGTFLPEGDSVDEAVSEGFSVSETETVEVDPGATIDDFDAETDAFDDDAADGFDDETVDAFAGETIEAGEPAPNGAILAEVAETGEVELDTEHPELSVPAAAQTIDLDETYLPRKRRNRAGLVVGAILALGLAGIAIGLLNSGDDNEAANGVTTEDPATSDTTAATEDAAATDDSAAAEDTSTDDGAATDTDTAADTTASSASSTTDSTASSTTESTATEDGASEDDDGTADDGTADVEVATATVPMADGPIAASDAGIQVLHGVPGAAVDVYVNGEAIATGFEAGTIAGPIAMEPGDYEVQLFSATDLAPASASDRSDDPIFTQMVPVSESAASLVAHLDADGEVAISPFLEQFTAVDPGMGRIMVRHLMATDEVDAAVDGEIIGSLAPGEEAALEIDAGTSEVELIGADGDVLITASVPVDDGELVSLSAIGSPADDMAEFVIQRYTGLATAPAAVPTGDSGLLDIGSDDAAGLRIAYGLMITLAVLGAVLAIWRRRSLA